MTGKENILQQKSAMHAFVSEVTFLLMVLEASQSRV